MKKKEQENSAVLSVSKKQLDEVNQNTKSIDLIMTKDTKHKVARESKFKG